MKNHFGLLILTLITSPAFADWARPVSHLEVLFSCNPAAPKFLAAAISIGPFGSGAEYSLGDAIEKLDALFSLSGNKISFHATPFGPSIEMGGLEETTIACTTSAHPSWHTVSFNPGTSLQLSLSSDVSTCSWDAENDGYTRALHYTLTATAPNDDVVSKNWDIPGHYASPNACQIED